MTIPALALQIPTLLALAAVAVAGSGFAPETDDALRGAKQIYVGTRRKDGMPGAVVPVWFMFDGEAIYFTTGPTSHKARRIARGSPLLVWVGRRDGRGARRGRGKSDRKSTRLNSSHSQISYAVFCLKKKKIII